MASKLTKEDEARYEAALREIFGEPEKKAVAPNPEGYSQLKQKLSEVLESLTEREKKVMELHLGIVDGRSWNIDEIGKQFKLTRDRIRQIQAKALRKMRHPARLAHLQEFLGDKGSKDSSDPKS